jgi:hypothetical protein
VREIYIVTEILLKVALITITLFVCFIPVGFIIKVPFSIYLQVDFYTENYKDEQH